jgi:MATE family multidrug resistance protein
MAQLVARTALREQAHLAIPLVLGQLGQQLMGLVDTAMLGRYDDAALAGAGIANALLFFITVFGMGTVMGLDSLVPQALGANDRKRARDLMWHGIKVATSTGLPLTILVAASPLLLPVAGVGEDVSAEVSVYIFGRLPAILPFLIFAALRSYLQARRITRPIVIAMIAGNLINVVADGFFIFGDSGLERIGLPAIGMPALGVLGAAIATTIISILVMVFIAIAVRRAPVTGYHRSAHQPALTRAIYRLGIPIGLQLVAEVGIFAITALLAGRLGTIPAAAHQVAITLASCTFAVVIGIGAATGVLVGRAVGAADQVATRRAGATGLVFGVGFMSMSAILFLAAPSALAGLFSTDPEVIAASVPLLRIAAVFQLSDGVQAIASGALRGAGDTRTPLLANLFGHYLIALPVAIILAFGYDLGASGLWWGLSTGLTVVAGLLMVRFFRLSSRPIAPS